MHKKILTGLVATTMLATATSALADDSSDWKSKMADLREQHSELKAQVESGEITKDEARETWTSIMKGVRAEKDSHFESRMDEARERAEKIAERNPERAAALQQRIVDATQRREEVKVEREELRQKVESGEITKEELKVIREEKKEEFNERKEEVKEEREARKAEFEAKREEQKEAREEDMAELKAQVESGEITKEEAKGIVETKRAEVQELRDNRPKPQRATDYNSSRSNKSTN